MLFVRKAAGALLALILLLSLLPPVRALEVQLWHRAYLSGFPDGTIRPEEPVTREQLAAILYRFLTPEAQEELGRRDTLFSDVPPNRWSYRAVSAAAGLGLLWGDESGCFHPEGTLSREELALCLTLCVQTRQAKAALPELSEAWAGQEVEFSAGNGWVMGFDGKCFVPGQALSRGELAHILNRILGRTPDSLDDLLVGMPLWSDNLDPAEPYFLDLQEAAVGHTAAIGEDGDEKWTALG